jgi:hypothetical protein
VLPSAKLQHGVNSQGQEKIKTTHIELELGVHKTSPKVPGGVHQIRTESRARSGQSKRGRRRRRRKGKARGRSIGTGRDRERLLRFAGVLACHFLLASFFSPPALVLLPTTPVSSPITELAVGTPPLRHLL